MSDIDSETLESSDFNKSTKEEQVEQNTEPELDPWPYINKFFKFDSHVSEKPLFRCQMCLPARKTPACTNKSRNGLKSHINRKHSHCFNAFKSVVLKLFSTRTPKNVLRSRGPPLCEKFVHFQSEEQKKRKRSSCDLHIEISQNLCFSGID